VGGDFSPPTTPGPAWRGVGISHCQPRPRRTRPSGKPVRPGLDQARLHRRALAHRQTHLLGARAMLANRTRSC